MALYSVRRLESSPDNHDLNLVHPVVMFIFGLVSILVWDTKFPVYVPSLYGYYAP